MLSRFVLAVDELDVRVLEIHVTLPIPSIDRRQAPVRPGMSGDHVGLEWTKAKAREFLACSSKQDVWLLHSALPEYKGKG